MSQRVKRQHLSLFKQSTWLSFHLRYRKKFDWIVSQIKSFSQCWDFAYQKKVANFVKTRMIEFSPKRLLSRKWLEILSWFNGTAFYVFFETRNAQQLINFTKQILERCTSKVKVSVPNQQNQQKNGDLKFHFQNFFLVRTFKRKLERQCFNLSQKTYRKQKRSLYNENWRFYTWSGRGTKLK